MPSLRYTNVVLTIIAVCLLYLCISPFVLPKQTATARAMPVEVVNSPAVTVEGTVDVEGSVDASVSDTVNVQVQNPELDVNVTNPSLSVSSY